MRVESKAGRWSATCYTDGFPFATSIDDLDRPEMALSDKQLSLEDLRDLHYVVGRMIARLEPKDRD